MVQSRSCWRPRQQPNEIMNAFQCWRGRQH
jgi:hypothetical protein